MNFISSVILCTLSFFVACKAVRKCGDGEKCILLDDCTPVMSALQKISNELRRGLLEYIRNNQLCGYENARIKLCCPSTQTSNENVVRCGIANASGDLNDPNNYPWVALLEYRGENDTDYRCGGVLINDRYVLTTATCLFPQEPIMIHFNVQHTDVSKNVENNIIKVPIKRIIIHEQFKFVSDLIFEENIHDIGLIELAENVSIKPICLPKQQIEQHPVEQYVAAGFATKPYRAKNGDTPKRVVTFKPVDKNTCRDISSTYDKDDLICAKSIPPASECDIDIGGGLSVNENGTVTLEGLYTLPDVCADNINRPYVYTKVRYYLNWIEEHIK